MATRTIKKGDDGGRMTAEQLRAWRERMGYSVTDACEALGIGGVSLEGWESGVEVPRYIALACAALALGIGGYGEEG
jgi:transcriptional regulator with XRE-family HTH domain